MLYVVLLTDSPVHGEVRQRLMPTHLAFLEQHQAHIRAAGPLQETADGRGAGGLWLVEAQSPEPSARWCNRIPSGRRASGIGSHSAMAAGLRRWPPLDLA
jgi:Uncharacterized protein conserved in bacteria